MTARLLDLAGSVVYATVLMVPLSACNRHDPGEPSTQAAAPQYNVIERTSLNRRAAELFLPIFWRDDANQNRAFDSNELAVLTGYPNSDRSIWIDNQGQFTPEFKKAYEQMQAADT